MFHAEDGGSTGSVGIATGHGHDDRGSIPGRGKRCFISTAFRSVLGSNQLPFRLVPGHFSPEVKWTGRETEQSPPSGVEVKKDGALRSLPQMSSWHSA
jgi:hypothetical protein